MSCLVKSRRANGTVYVYRSTSVWNSEKGYPVPKRTLIGKLDEATGQIIPTRKQNRSKKGSGATDVQGTVDIAPVETGVESAPDPAETPKDQETCNRYQEGDTSLEALVRMRLAKAKRMKAAMEKEIAEMQKFVLELDTAIQEMQDFDV